MAYIDLFRESVPIEPDRVHDICRIRKKAEIFDLVGVSEPMAEWMAKAHSIGATVVPRQVYNVRLFEQHDHRVGWFYSSYREEDRVIDQHHIACDCIASIDNPVEDMDKIIDCTAVIHALNHRAARVGEVLGSKQILEYYGKSEGALTVKACAVISAKALINFVMNHEKVHPESWWANVVSGEHQISLLASILQVEPYSDPDSETSSLTLQDIVEEMHEDGSLRLHDDGMTVSLPEAA